MHNMFQKVYRQIQTFDSKIDVWYLEKDRGDDDNDDDDDDNCVNHQPGYDATCVRQVTSTKTQILKSNGRKRKIDIHVNSDFKRAYFMSEEDKRASADSYCLWSTKGEIDCSQCKKLNTPCDATLFILPHPTRFQLLQRCGREGGKHFMEEKYCLLCKIQNPQKEFCPNNIWGCDGNLNTYKDGLIQIMEAVENRWEEMLVMKKISPDFVERFAKRWDEIFGGKLPSYMKNYLSQWKD